MRHFWTAIEGEIDCLRSIRPRSHLQFNFHRKFGEGKLIEKKAKALYSLPRSPRILPLLRAHKTATIFQFIDWKRKQTREARPESRKSFLRSIIEE